MSMSRTALDVRLERWELEELIQLLIEKMHRCADRQEYGEADSFKRRARELREIAKTPLPPPVG